MRRTTGLWPMRQPGWRCRYRLAMCASTPIRQATRQSGCWKVLALQSGFSAARKVLQEPSEQLGRLVLTEQQALQEIKDRSDQLAPREMMEPLVLQGQQAPRVQPVQQVAQEMSQRSFMLQQRKQRQLTQTNWPS